MRWIAYGDGWEFTSDDGAPGDVPAFGCLVVAQENEKLGRRLLHGASRRGDFFVWIPEHGEWDIKDYAGLVDALANFPGCVVRFGRGVPDRVARGVFRRARDDDRLPPKGAWEPQEKYPKDWR